MGQDGGMSTQVLYPRVCPLQGAFCEGVTAIPFRGKPAVEVAHAPSSLACVSLCLPAAKVRGRTKPPAVADCAAGGQKNGVCAADQRDTTKKTTGPGPSGCHPEHQAMKCHRRTELPQIDGHSGRGALEGKGPQRRPNRRLGRRLEEVAKAVGSGCYRLQMPLKLAVAVRETVAGHRLDALEGGGGVPPPLQCIPALG